MRLNRYIALATGMSRRAADKAITAGQVLVNGRRPDLGQDVTDTDQITLGGQKLTNHVNILTYLLHKPIGYVSSRDGQGNKTIYDLLPPELHHLKPVGRLDKNSSGLLLLTNDGTLAYELTHPSFQKTKVYKIALNRPLESADKSAILSGKVMLDGLPSKLRLEPINDRDTTNWKVIMQEGRNRQIRRTFEAVGYNVVKLHRTHFGQYSLGGLNEGQFTVV